MFKEEGKRKEARTKAQWEVGYIPNDSAFRRCRILICEDKPEGKGKNLKSMLSATKLVKGRLPGA
jgi:hypothetical protein